MNSTTLGGLLRNQVKNYIDKTFLLSEEKSLSYRELNEEVNRLAHSLTEIGIKKGDRLALLLPNVPEFCTTYFALANLGAIAVPLNTRLKSGELKYIINDSASSILIMDPSFWNVIEPIRKNLKSVKHIIWIEEEEKMPKDILLYRELIERKKGYEPTYNINISEDNIAAILYTSGTTGLPKGAMMTHKNVLTNAKNCKYCLGITEEDITLVAVPLFHVTGLNSQLVAMLYAGGSVALLRYYKTDEVIRLIDKYKVTMFFTAPTILVLMLMRPALKEYDLSSLKIIAYGGGPIAPDTIRTLKEAFPQARCVQAYGLTETSSIATYHPDEYALLKTTSVGKPAPGVQVKIIGKEGDELPVGKIGEIVIKADNVVKGYWNKPEETRKSIVEGWLFTGDLGKIDEEGFLYLMDRKKDMVCRGAENIYSKEVEDVLYSHPAVLEAALYGVPDKIFGEVPRVAIVLKPGMEATEEEIREFCKGKLADFKVPTKVKFLEELPKNPGGKILKRALSEEDIKAEGIL